MKRSWSKIANIQGLVLNKHIRDSDFAMRSTEFHKGEELFDVFNIKGPMGKGLCI